MALAHQGWGQLIASRLVGFVDFRDADPCSDVDNRTRLSWFQLLVGLAKKARAYLPQVARTADQVVEWLDKVIGPSLAVVMRFWQGDIGALVGVIGRGERRWKPRHKAMVAGMG